MIHTSNSSKKLELQAGIKATVPLVIGAIPFGIIFGALAVNSGISPYGTMGMSLFVFAGSSQFIAAGLVARGVSIGIIILTTFIVNFRHALYATTLSPYMKHLSQNWLLPLGFWLTDESFLVSITRFKDKDDSPHKHWFFLGSALFMYLNWQLCTFIGIIAGQSIPNPEKWGLEFAMIVTFIGMLIPMIKNKSVTISIIVSALTALIFRNLPNQLGLLIAVILGIFAGISTEKR